MRHVVPFATLLVSACLPPTVVRDPHAVAPEYDRWEARIPAEPRTIFGAVLDVLGDSGYTARHADPAVGIIATNARTTSISGITHDYRLDVMILPAGDSARLIIRGEYCQVYDGAQQCYARRAWADDWKVVQGIGEAILRRTTGARRDWALLSALLVATPDA